MQPFPAAAADGIAARLASLNELRLPGQMKMKREGKIPSEQERRQYVCSLLLHDPGVLLERHGELLTAGQRGHFEGLRSDYEVDFYLRQLEGNAAEATAAPVSAVSSVAKNRRLAALNRLVAEGSYFKDDAMRQRQPYLHHLYVSQYRPDGERAAGAAAGAGGGWAATGGGGAILAQSIMRQEEELELKVRQEAERERYELQESEEEEEEASELESELAATGKAQAAAVAGPSVAEPPAPAHVQISEEEREEYSAAFLDHMKQRFLSGQEPDVDYAGIDADAELDEDLAKESERDIHEQYFDAD